jgi:amyloid beta precursor protein binding protein 1
MSGQTPQIQGPTAKEKKYDRQLRLWGANGQQALENAHVLLINSGPGAVGVETLKNLILPGIGSFTIHDSAVVTEQDLGINFFLDDSCLGKSRAQMTCEYLNELNPDVRGHFDSTVSSSMSFGERRLIVRNSRSFPSFFKE